MGRSLALPIVLFFPAGSLRSTLGRIVLTALLSSSRANRTSSPRWAPYASLRYRPILGLNLHLPPNNPPRCPLSIVREGKGSKPLRRRSPLSQHHRSPDQLSSLLSGSHIEGPLGTIDLIRRGLYCPSHMSVALTNHLRLIMIISVARTVIPYGIGI